ncbi:MAG: SPOR domain-containing protein [Pseudomonadota bacterium]
MPLPSFLQRLSQRTSAPVADASPLSSADIEVARARARRRLVGMVVLVGAGVVGFPWLFETQPRPMSTDVQVVSTVSSRANVSPPSGPVPTIVAVTPPMPRAPEPLAVRPVIDEPAPVFAPKPSPAASQTSRSSVSAGSSPVAAVLDRPAAKPAAKPSVKPAPAPSKPTAADVATRYVIQIGAFAEGPAAHEVRMKAERAGIKTYTQVVTTDSGKKVRVRIGPYASKADADKAMATLKKAGLSGALLTL